MQEAFAAFINGIGIEEAVHCCPFHNRDSYYSLLLLFKIQKNIVNLWESVSLQCQREGERDVKRRSEVKNVTKFCKVDEIQMTLLINNVL